MIKIFDDRHYLELEDRVNKFLSVNNYKLIDHKLVIKNDIYYISLQYEERF